MHADPPPFFPVVLMCAELMCAKLKIANAKTIRYSDPKGAHGERQEGSRATYTCMPGFAKAGNKDSRVCKSGKFDGAQQLCVGEFTFCVWRKSRACWVAHSVLMCVRACVIPLCVAHVS